MYHMFLTFLSIKVPKQNTQRTTSTSMHASEPADTTFTTMAENSTDTPTTICSQSIMTEHGYCLDSPRKLKQKYDRILSHLHAKRQQLFNTRRREMRAKKTIKTLLTKACKLNMLNEQAMQQLSAYSSKNFFFLLFLFVYSFIDC